MAAPTAMADEVARLGIPALVIDVEGTDGGPRLGLAAELAGRTKARNVAVSDLDPVSLG